MLSKQQILEALQKWINQRPGLEFGNYGELSSYRAELRQIAKDKRDAQTLLAAVAIRDSITAEDLIAATRAYSGRLQIKERVKQHTAATCPGHPCSPVCDHKEFQGAEIEYCTGQYWPTEYRKAACAVLASALWDNTRNNMDAQERQQRAGESYMVIDLLAPDGKSAGDRIRAYFKREFGRSIQSRWFD